jgi:hypothetical protein
MKIYLHTYGNLCRYESAPFLLQTSPPNPPDVSGGLGGGGFLTQPLWLQRQPLPPASFFTTASQGGRVS